MRGSGGLDHAAGPPACFKVASDGVLSEDIGMRARTSAWTMARQAALSQSVRPPGWGQPVRPTTRLGSTGPPACQAGVSQSARPPGWGQPVRPTTRLGSPSPPDHQARVSQSTYPPGWGQPVHLPARLGSASPPEHQARVSQSNVANLPQIPLQFV